MTAKEMFEKLGYKYNKYTTSIGYYKEYDNIITMIEFDLTTKSVKFQVNNNVPFIFYANDEIKAINKQIEELG